MRSASADRFYLHNEQEHLMSLSEQLRARVRLLRLVGDRNDLSMEIAKLMVKAANRLEELGDREVYSGTVVQKPGQVPAG